MNKYVHLEDAGSGSFNQLIEADREGRVSIEFWKDRTRLAAPFVMTRQGARDLLEALHRALMETEEWFDA